MELCAMSVMTGPYDGSALPAAPAGAGDLERVCRHVVAVAPGHFGHPCLQCRRLDLDGRAARGADDVMVVVRRLTPAVGELAPRGADHVDGAVVGQDLQRAIDARQTHALAAVPQPRVDLLRGQEPVA